MYGELTFPTYTTGSGRFKQGHIPFNKGKTWTEYMPKRSAKRASKGWKNLQTHRPKKRSDVAGRCRKKVVLVTDDGKFRIFAFLQEVADFIGGSRENCGRCCRANEAKRRNLDTHGRPTDKVNTDHKYKGYRLYFYTDDCWWDKIKD